MVNVYHSVIPNKALPVLQIHGSHFVLTLSQRQIIDSSKLKEFADNNFNLNLNGRKFPKWVERTVGKGEIAYYKQFLLLPQCFINTFLADM